MEREETPGLKRIRRGDGTERLMWACSEPARRAGFKPRTMNLSHLAANPAGLAAACRRLTVEMAAFLRGAERAPTAYDGTFATLLAIYETHPQSPYHKLAPSSARPYSQYARRLKRMIGAVRIDETTSADMSEWFDIWAGPDGHVAGARMTIAVLKAALTFGKGLRLQGCADLRAGTHAENMADKKDRDRAYRGGPRPA